MTAPDDQRRSFQDVAGAGQLQVAAQKMVGVVEVAEQNIE